MLLFLEATALTLPFLVKPTLVIGGEAMQKLEKNWEFLQVDAEKLKAVVTTEGLMKAIIDDQDPLTSGYKKNTLFYSISGNWTERFQNISRPWWASLPSDYILQVGGHIMMFLANKVMAISPGTDGTTTLCLYGKSNQPSTSLSTSSAG